MKTTKLLILTCVISLNSSFAQEKIENDASFPDLEGSYLGQRPPGLVPELFAPDIIKTEHREAAAAFTPDLKEFYFRRRGGEYKNNTLVVVQYKDNRWTESVVPPRAGEPFISHDNKILYLGKKYRERTNSGWSEVKSLGQPFKDIPIMRLTASSIGTYFFDTIGENPIRYSRLIDGKHEKPRTLNIEMGKYNAHPFIAPDESYLIWDHQGEGGYGKADIYISFRQQDGSWGDAINLGDKINTEFSEAYGSVSPDGKYFFFHRGFGGDTGDIYWVDAKFIETLRPPQSSVEESKADTTIDLIEKVENGLTTRVYIEGDSTWSIEERMEHYGIPGVSIAVINNGKIQWAKGYGVMDKVSKAPVTKQTIFQTVSQPLTAYGALRLVEQNKVSLNKDINNYLKSWKVPENEFTKKKKVTIKHLLNHSAGIKHHGIGGYSTGSSIPTLLEVLNGIAPAKNDPVLLIKAPEESHYNSAGGYTIIQQMMIDVEGKKFPEIMNELVLQPLEMKNSTFNQTLSKKQLTVAATGYLKDGSMVKGKSHIYPAMSTSGLWTTAEDLAKFVINIQQTPINNSNKGLSKDMTALMLTKSPFVEDNYGLGTYVYNKKDETYFGQGKWNRGFFGQMTAHKDKGYGVVILTNSTFPEFNAEVMRSVALVYDWSNYVPVHQKMQIEQSSVDEITGRYQSDDVIVEIYQKDNQLFYKNILDEQGVELIKVSDSLFVRRNSSRFIQFKPGSENAAVNLQYLNRNDGAIISTLIKVANDKKSPVEFLLEGDFENALIAYKNLMELDPTHPTVTEGYINDIAYDFYHADRMTLSLNTFKVNMMLYPDSYKVYDSYAEACMKAGKIDLAILNYSKSLELNPQNNRASSKLKELQKSE